MLEFSLSILQESGTVLKYKPQDMIFTSDKTKEMFSVDYDKYGDSYVDDVSEDELKRIFKNISVEVLIIFFVI